jgi:hypothetical protein
MARPADRIGRSMACVATNSSGIGRVPVLCELGHCRNVREQACAFERNNDRNCDLSLRDAVQASRILAVALRSVAALAKYPADEPTTVMGWIGSAAVYGGTRVPRRPVVRHARWACANDRKVERLSSMPAASIASKKGSARPAWRLSDQATPLTSGRGRGLA